LRVAPGQSLPLRPWLRAGQSEPCSPRTRPYSIVWRWRVTSMRPASCFARPWRQSSTGQREPTAGHRPRRHCLTQACRLGAGGRVIPQAPPEAWSHFPCPGCRECRLRPHNEHGG
jgi:hypothetical protein